MPAIYGKLNFFVANVYLQIDLVLRFIFNQMLILKSTMNTQITSNNNQQESLWKCEEQRNIFVNTIEHNQLKVYHCNSITNHKMVFFTS